MAGVAYMTITGFNELSAKISQLAKTDIEKTNAIRAILRKVAESTVSAAKGFVNNSDDSHWLRGEKIKSGNLKKSIGTITGKSRENPTIYVGPRVKNGYKGWYGAMVESGHNVYSNPGNAKAKKKNGNSKSVLARITHRNPGNKVGFVPGQLFMKQAYSVTGGLVVKESESAVAKYFQKRINAMSK